VPISTSGIVWPFFLLDAVVTVEELLLARPVLRRLRKGEAGPLLGSRFHISTIVKNGEGDIFEFDSEVMNASFSQKNDIHTKNTMSNEVAVSKISSYHITAKFLLTSE